MIMIHPTIETLRRLRLTGMAKALEEQQGLPDCDRLSFDERLAMLVDREAVERDNAALAQRLRLAKLRQAACLEDVDYRTPRGLDRSLIHSLATSVPPRSWLRRSQSSAGTTRSAIRPMPTPSSTGLFTMPTASSCGATRCAAANRICLGMKRINQINNLQHLSTLLTQSATDHHDHYKR